MKTRRTQKIDGGFTATLGDRPGYWSFFVPDGTRLGTAFRRPGRLAMAPGWYTGFSSRDYIGRDFAEAARRLAAERENR